MTRETAHWPDLLLQTELQSIARIVTRKESRRVFGTLRPAIYFSRSVGFLRGRVTSSFVVFPNPLPQLKQGVWRFDLEAWVARRLGGIGIVSIESDMDLLA